MQYTVRNLRRWSISISTIPTLSQPWCSHVADLLRIVSKICNRHYASFCRSNAVGQGWCHSFTFTQGCCSGGVGHGLRILILQCISSMALLPGGGRCAPHQWQQQQRRYYYCHSEESWTVHWTPLHRGRIQQLTIIQTGGSRWTSHNSGWRQCVAATSPRGERYKTSPLCASKIQIRPELLTYEELDHPHFIEIDPIPRITLLNC